MGEAATDRRASDAGIVPPQSFIKRWTSGADGDFGICLLCGLVDRELPVEHGCRPNLSDDELAHIHHVVDAKRGGAHVNAIERLFHEREQRRAEQRRPQFNAVEWLAQRANVSTLLSTSGVVVSSKRAASWVRRRAGRLRGDSLGRAQRWQRQQRAHDAAR